MRVQSMIDGYQHVCCPTCELIKVGDPPDGDVIEALYSAEYYKKFDERYVSVTEKERARWQRRLDDIEQHHQLDGRRLLDVGCGTGAFLAVAAENGWQPTGVEQSTFAAEIAEQRIDQSTIYNDLFAVPHRSGFDAIACWNVIEHLTHPADYLLRMYELLKPNGTLTLATVNTDAANHLLFGSRWRYYSPPEHLIFFNKYNLERLLRNCGFDCVQTNHIFNGTAFWQGVTGNPAQPKSRVKRAVRKALSAPVGLAAEHLQAGDIIEIVARRRPNF